jgi:hypothetical protein
LAVVALAGSVLVRRARSSTRLRGSENSADRLPGTIVVICCRELVFGLFTPLYSRRIWM